MLNLLKKLDSHDLYYAIGADKIHALNKLVPDGIKEEEVDIINLSKYILAIYGFDLLYEQKMRHLLFTLIDENKLKELAVRYSKSTYEKPYDNALALSLCPWKSGTKFVIEVAKELSIPKEYLPLKSYRNQTVELIDPIDELFNLHEYQEDLKSKIIRALKEGQKKFLIQMPTGAGKTRTILEALIDYIYYKEIFFKQKSIVWLAHTEELCEQAIDTFKDVWQHIADSPVQIVRCWGNYNPNSFDIIGSFVVATFQKINNLIKNNSDVIVTLSNICSVVVVDEAHKSIAPTYAKGIKRLIRNGASDLIGLTATPGRGVEKIQENKELSNFFNKKLLAPGFEANPIQELREKKILAKINRKIIRTNIDIEIKKLYFESDNITYDLPTTIIHNLAQNTNRNRIILDVIFEELTNNNPCLVFSCSLDHSKTLSSIVNYKGFSSSYIDCYMRKGSRKRTIDGFRKGEYDVLFNYGVLSTGFDAPRIRTVIITRPTSSVVLYSQMIGRGLRGPKMGGTEVCNLIDIKDNYLNFGGVEEVYTFFEQYWR
jgi:superfamily II DNA or RNA helicase